MKNISGRVSVNEFVRRQVKGSGKTYVEGLSLEKIAQHAQEQLANGNYRHGYRNGVVLAHIDKSLHHYFLCPFVRITEEAKLKATVVRRRPEEDPYIQIRALSGISLKTGSVDLILYHHDVLMETNEETSNADWELISFHAIPDGIEEMPMGPVTMMRNQLQLTGGTKAFHKSEEWAESIKFWQKYAVLGNNDG